MSAAEVDLAAITFDDQGLVPAIAQDVDTGDVLMLAWMNAESLRLTLAEGRMVYWSRSRHGALAQRRHERRRANGSRGVLRLRRRHPVVQGDPARSRRLSHRGAQLLLHAARRRHVTITSAGASDRSASGGSVPKRPAWPGNAMNVRPSRDEFHRLAAGAHGRPRLDRASRRPGDTGCRLRQARRRR